MQNVLQTGKRVFGAALAAATIAFTVGAASLVAPVTAKAASAGDLIKGTSLSTVYYYGYDGMRYTFPNETTYMTWFSDFSDVNTISDSALADITLGGNVTMRPGSWWIKITSDSKVYAVARNGMIHWVESEDVATGFAGSDWNKRIVDVSDAFFPDYTVGTSLMDSTAYEGMMYEMGGDTYIVWDGEMRMVTSSGMSANNLMSKFVMDGTGIDDSALSMGDDVDGAMTTLMDASQTATSDDEVGSATGDIMIDAASSMPNGVTVTQGANAVEVFSFDVSAGSDDATLDSVTLSMIGAGSASDLEDVYLYEGNTRLTESRSVNSSTRQVTFSNLDLMVDAGDTRTLTVRVAISTSASASNTFGFEIADDEDVMASGDVSGAPVEGDTFTVSGADSGTLTIDKTGSISDPSLGEQDAEIGEFKVTADGEDAWVSMITLKIDNAADHSDFRLWDGNDEVAMGENTWGDFVMFDLSEDPFFIEEGNNNIFTVSADIGGQAGDEISVYVDNNIDVEAVGGDYGFGLTVDSELAGNGSYSGTDCDSTSSTDCSFSEVQGGDVTIAFNGPSAGDIEVDGQDEVLLSFSITAANEVTVKDLDVIVYGDDDADSDAFDAIDDAGADADGLINGSEYNLEDIKIVDEDGRVWMGPEELSGTDDADETVSFTEDFTLDAGETVVLMVTADVNDAATSGTEFGATLDVSSLDIEDENGDSLTTDEIVPSSDVVGYNQEAMSSSLTFALASTPGDVTTVQGSDDVHVVSFSATAGDAADINITDLTLTVYAASDLDSDGFADETFFNSGSVASADTNDYIESCSLYNGSTLVAGPEGLTSNGVNVIFDNFDWTLEASEVDSIDVICDFANPSVSTDSAFGFTIASNSDVVAEDEDGDSISVSGAASVNGTNPPTNMVTVAASGELTIAVGASTPSADFILTGSSNNLVSSFRFTADNEDYEVNTLSFSEEQGEDDSEDSSGSATANSSMYANNVSLVTIKYPKEDGTTGTKTATMSGNVARFSNLDMYVSVDENADVNVYVDVPMTDRSSGGSATSNEKIRMGLYANSNNFEAVGAGSGETIVDADISVIGDDSTDGVKTFVVRETKPTISLSSSSPSGASAPGRNETMRFNVAASSGEDVVINSFTFKIVSTDAGGSGWNTCDTTPADSASSLATSEFDIYNYSENASQTLEDTNSGTWTVYDSVGVACDGTNDTSDVTYAKITLGTPETIAKGTTATFSVYVDTTGASSSPDDSIRLDLSSDPGTLTDSGVDVSGAIAGTATGLTVTGTNDIENGDVICVSAAADTDCADSGDEYMLVVSGGGTTSLTVVRGYAGTNAEGGLNTFNVYFTKGSLLWQDDGTTTATDLTEEYWGGYLVDSLTVSGGQLTF